MKAVILAAGMGTRLKSENTDLPKALRLAHGKPLIQYVIENLSFLAPEDIIIVVGYQKEKVMETLGPRYCYAEQTDINGTARAALCAEAVLGSYNGPVMVLYCDMPLLRRKTYEDLFKLHQSTQAAGTLLAGRIHPIPEFGHLIRDENGRLLDIIEHSACTPQQRLIDEVNIGIQIMNSPAMWPILRSVKNDNPKREFYLTSTPGIMVAQGMKVEVAMLEDAEESLGVNSMEDLALVESALSKRAGE